MVFVVQRFLSLGCTETAASLSYTSLLSLVPLLAVIFAGFSSFSVFEQLFSEVQNFIFTNFVPSSSELIQQYLNEFIGKASRLTLVGLLGLFAVAIMLMWQIDRSLNQIWGMNKGDNILRTLLTYWAVLTLGPLLMGVSLMISSYIVSLPLITDAADTVGVKTQMLMLIPILMTLFTFTMVYLIVPNTRVPLGHALVGGLTATLFFELSKRGFAFYISHNTMYTNLYGTLAIIPIFLIWIYISWLVTLLGAVTSHCMSLFDFSREQNNYSVHRFQSAFHILRVLSKAAQSGQVLSDKQIHKEALLRYEKFVDEILSELEQSGWVLKTENKFWALAKDLQNVTLWDFYQKLPYPLPKNNTQDPLSVIIAQANGVLAKELNLPVKTIFARYDDQSR